VTLRTVSDVSFLVAVVLLILSAVALVVTARPTGLGRGARRHPDEDPDPRGLWRRTRRYAWVGVGAGVAFFLLALFTGLAV
jgi:hypothetical protein